MPAQTSPNFDLQFLIDTITHAGDITLQYFKKNFTIEQKSGNQGIVTTADFASEQWIKQHIQATFPSHAILAEESGLTDASNPGGPRFMWIIDPLDGTSNFSKGNPYYCVSIAFGEVSAGSFSPLAAAIYHPPSKDLFYAQRGAGTHVNGKKISLSPAVKFCSSSFVTGFSSNRGETLNALFPTMAAIQNKGLSIRINGAAALDLAYTACGIFDGFYENPLAPWDMAAGALLIEEAGGIVSNYSGESFCPLKDKGVVAGNLNIHSELLEIIQSNAV